MRIPFKVFLDTQNILSGYDTPALHQDIAIRDVYCKCLDTQAKVTYFVVT
jgi:hypothetical protein